VIGLLIFVKGSKGGSWTGLLIIRSLVGGVWLVGGADGTLSSFSFSTSGVWISLLVGETNEDLEEINKGGAPLVDQDIPIEAAGSWWP
jgi:hypothetical protein